MPKIGGAKAPSAPLPPGSYAYDHKENLFQSHPTNLPLFSKSHQMQPPHTLPNKGNSNNLTSICGPMYSVFCMANSPANYPPKENGDILVGMDMQRCSNT